jgi:hypothetical protein
MNTPNPGHLFLVGCPRSGTTLLQSLLAAHSQIISFPESHFFEHLSARWPWGDLFGLASGRASQQFHKFLTVIEQENLEDYIPKKAIFSQQYSRAFIEVLDRYALEHQKSWWLEKTPQHLRCIALIENQVDNPKFIHLIRNGEDVVASLYDASRKHSEKTWGGAWNIDRCIQVWIGDVEHSRKHLKKSNHILVKYETLVQNAESVLNTLCQFVGIEFEKSMMEDYTEAAKQVVREHEWAWKASAGAPIKNANGEKFLKLFSEEERQYISDRIAEAKVNELPELQLT